MHEPPSVEQLVQFVQKRIVFFRTSARRKQKHSISKVTKLREPKPFGAQQFYVIAAQS